MSTYIDIDPVPVEDGGLWIIRGDVSVELVSVSVPLDGVQFVPFEVVAAAQFGVLTPDRVRRDQHVHQLDGVAQI